jgi:hypothetical protein
MSCFIYHPIQEPKIVTDEEGEIYLLNGWHKSYSEIPGYVANEHGENTNKTDEYLSQFDDSEPEIKKRGRPAKAKHCATPLKEEKAGISAQ